MNVVEKLAENHSAKMTYYLTKFDTAGDEVDRTNVVSQIVQELQGRVKATHALKLHTMYLPERASEEVKKTVLFPLSTALTFLFRFNSLCNKQSVGGVERWGWRLATLGAPHVVLSN
jgi:hypothetical protein